MNYKMEAVRLVQNLNQRLDASPYDIAWMARLEGGDGSPKWPAFLDWLLANQYEDGSWGSDIVYYHDRVLCTITAVTTLNRYNHHPQAAQAIQKAEQYLWHHLHWLHSDPADLAGFELLFPTLLTEATVAGLNVPNHTCGYGKIQAQKLRLIPPPMLYSPKASIVHSLEFLGVHGDMDKLHAALSPMNGSLGNSPATTTYFLLLAQQHGLTGVEIENAYAYLERVKQYNGYSMTVHPLETFETVWVLNNFSFTGIPVTEFAETAVLQQLHNHLHPYGVGADPSFVPDGDTTSVCMKLLYDGGWDVDPAVLAIYEDKEQQLFLSYPYERDASISTNAHVLETLMLLDTYPNQKEILDNICVMLLNQRRFDVYWTDKWHISPYYATSHVVIALLKGGKFLIDSCLPTIQWLLNTQYPDGSWGFFSTGTVEETAFVMTALLHYHQYKPIHPDVLHKGAHYLAEAYETTSTYPAMWIAKSLFTPHDIVRSSILTALILYEEMFG